jgi:predicted nucleic acid-binding protein
LEGRGPRTDDGQNGRGLTVAEPTAFVDTSVLVRYLTDDHAELSPKAAEILESDQSLAVSLVALAEAGYVLESVYSVPRPVAARTLSDLLARRNLMVLGLPKARILEALAHCAGSRSVSYADALQWAEVRESAAATIYTFDDRFPTDGIEVLRSPRPPDVTPGEDEKLAEDDSAD